MGIVYEGENVRIGRRVAIKVLHAHVASSPEFAHRFEREARASARIGSPHVCDVLDLGDLPNGARYLVMEFLEGESLEDRLATRRLTAVELAPIAFDILEGLRTMHLAGVIHRDLKPANVFLVRAHMGKGDFVKILDFGVAKIQTFAGDANANGMTSTGMMMGTPLYMSPEQARGARDVDARTDLFAASVIFYRALTGRLPHAGDNINELLFKIVLEDPPSIRQIAPEVDEGFAAIVAKGLVRDANERYASARDYQAAIAAWGSAQGTVQLSLPKESVIPSVPVHVTGIAPIPTSEPNVASAASAPSVPLTQKPIGEGTPTAWSEDARALAGLESKQVQSGKTQRIDLAPPTPVPAPAPAAPRRKVGVIIGAAAGVVAVLGFVGLRLGGQRSVPPVASATAASEVVSVTTIETPPAPSASAEPTPEVTAPPPPVSVVKPSLPRVAAPAPALPPSAAAASAAAVPSATAPGHRKFRTNL
jgi:serine/threonine-protein kinase